MNYSFLFKMGSQNKKDILPKGGTLDGGCECGVASGEGATEAGEARKAPTLLMLAPAPPLVL